MMSDHDQRSDDAFGERVGRVLRASERFGDHFEADLVEAIRNEAPRGRFVLRPRARGSAWWTTPITVRMSPLVGLAMAASVALVAALSVRGSRVSGAPAVTNVAQVVRDTVNVVRFVFVGDARSVALVGDFNAWREDATPLSANTASGTWSVSVPLPRGRHEYAFIVDGKRWVADPFAPSTSDEFNTASSVVTVGT
jgi:hypothetical protein